MNEEIGWFPWGVLCVSGRVIQQEIGVNLSWFQGLSESLFALSLRLFFNGLSLTWLYCCILACGCVVFLWHVSATCAMISYIACGHNISSGNCLFYVLGSEASRESVKAGERNSGGEGERHTADSAFAGLRLHCKRSEQCWTYTGELTDR